jgi:hypothetical protein
VSFRQSGEVSEDIHGSYADDFESESHVGTMNSGRKSGFHGSSSKNSGSMSEDIHGTHSYTDEFESESAVGTVSGRHSGFHGSVGEDIKAGASVSYADDFESESHGATQKSIKKQVGFGVSGEISEDLMGASVSYGDDFESESASHIGTQESLGRSGARSIKESIGDGSLSEDIHQSTYSQEFESDSHQHTLKDFDPNQHTAIIIEEGSSESGSNRDSGRMSHLQTETPEPESDVPEEISEYSDDFEEESVGGSSHQRSLEDVQAISTGSYRSEEDVEAASGSDIEWVLMLEKSLDSARFRKDAKADEITDKLIASFVEEITTFL